MVPLQTLLVKIINQATASDMITSQTGLDLSQSGPVGPTAESVRAATMVVAIVPIVLVYPFLQRYFVSGILVGSIKE
jgi:putative aldouronate transport system permease protein